MAETAAGAGLRRAPAPRRRRVRRAQQRARDLLRQRGQRAARASTATRYDVVPVGITPDGRWVLGADDPDRLAIDVGQLPAVDGTGAQVVLAGDPTVGRPGASSEPGAGAAGARRRSTSSSRCCTGRYGEDGTLQGLLELAGVPYVGSGVLASAAAMDKAVDEGRCSPRPGCPVGAVRRGPGPRLAVARRRSSAIRAALALPVFVKPARAGSSVGVSKVARVGRPRRRRRGRPAAHDPKVVVEQGVVGREIECGVLRVRGRARRWRPASAARSRVHGGHEFYDFEAKYLEVDDVTRARRPGRPADDVADRVRELAAVAFRALDCEGFARVDFFVGRRRRASPSTRSTPSPASPRCRCSRCCGRRAACRTRRWSTGCCASALRKRPGLR